MLNVQAPFEVRVHVSTLLLMDAHAHSSRAEVMGLLGGDVTHCDVPGAGSRVVLTVTAYRPAQAAAGSTHCDMDPGKGTISLYINRQNTERLIWIFS